MKKIHHIVFAIVIVLWCSCVATGKEKSSFFDDLKHTVVIDPGHGGHDHGAKGPDGTLEKIASLNFARLLAAELKNEYEVAFTRIDDYLVDIPERTAVANHSSADLFLTIHTSGSIIHGTKGVTIFYYNKMLTSVRTNGIPSSKLNTNHNSMVTPWNDIQIKHKSTSLALAKRLQSGINKLKKNKNCKIRGAPFVVLAGADMPAVLIEIGHLTNPVEEKELVNNELLSDLAKVIRYGIDEFFAK